MVPIELANKYREKYAHINSDMCERMVSQLRSNHGTRDIDIFYFKDWSETKERTSFWYDLYSLQSRRELTEEHIRKVYDKYKIPFIPNNNTHTIDIWFQ